MKRNQYSFISCTPHKQKVWLLIVLLVSTSVFNSSCHLFRKLKPAGKHPTVNTQNTHPLQIEVNDIYKKMPHSIIYNLGDSVKLYLGQSTYSYADSYLVIHIPVTDDSLSYIYGAKYALRPNETLVYAVRFFPDNDSLDKKFSGDMKWINFQNWKAFGLRYRSGKLVAYMTPVVLAKPGWEDCGLCTYDKSERKDCPSKKGFLTNSVNTI